MNDKNRLINIRKKAEDLLNDKPFNVRDFSVNDIEQILHELHVHQIELELQNDELRSAQLELEISRNKYFNLFNMAPVAFLSLDENFVIFESNAFGEKLLGSYGKSIIGKSLTQFIAPDYQDKFYFYSKDVLLLSEVNPLELMMKSIAGKQFRAWTKCLLEKDIPNERTYIRCILHDIAGYLGCEGIYNDLATLIDNRIEDEIIREELRSLASRLKKIFSVE